MPREDKVAVVEELKDKLGRTRGAILADYRGLNVKQVTELRKRLREAGIEYKVFKNTLATIAAKDLGYDGLVEHLTGPTAIAFGYEDAVAPAKILSDFAKDNKALELKGGLLSGTVIGVDQVKELADLPSREQLLAMVVRGMQAPIAGMVNVLQGNIRNVVYALEAIRKQKEEAGA